jgi:hypothetical protein
LLSVDRPEFAVLVGPFVPDGDPVLAQVPRVGVPAQEPKQFVDAALEVDPFRGQQRKAGLEVEPHLVPEQRARTDAGPVRALDAPVKQGLQKVKILLLRMVRHL